MRARQSWILSLKVRVVWDCPHCHRRTVVFAVLRPFSGFVGCHWDFNSPTGSASTDRRRPASKCGGDHLEQLHSPPNASMQGRIVNDTNDMTHARGQPRTKPLLVRGLYTQHAEEFQGPNGRDGGIVPTMRPNETLPIQRSSTMSSKGESFSYTGRFQFFSCPSMTNWIQKNSVADIHQLGNLSSRKWPFVVFQKYGSTGTLWVAVSFEKNDKHFINNQPSKQWVRLSF